MENEVSEEVFCSRCRHLSRAHPNTHVMKFECFCRHPEADRLWWKMPAWKRGKDDPALICVTKKNQLRPDDGMRPEWCPLAQGGKEA